MARLSGACSLLLATAALLQGAQAQVINEYIGAQPGGLTMPLSELTHFGTHISNTERYNLILGFATDTNGNGQFTPFWEADTFTGANIAAFKQAHPNVKVMFSIGGDKETWVDSAATSGNCSSWIATALASVQGLFSQYNLDGVDFDYEHFSPNPPANFATCIAGLAAAVNGDDSSKLISIAPFGATNSIYQALWAKANINLDFVNYQAYAGAPNSNVGTSFYTTLFQGLQKSYPTNTGPNKLLLGLDTNANSPRGQQFSDDSPNAGITGTVASLYSQGLIGGAMIFDAEDSANADWVTEGSIENVFRSSSG